MARCGVCGFSRPCPRTARAAAACGEIRCSFPVAPVVLVFHACGGDAFLVRAAVGKCGVAERRGEGEEAWPDLGFIFWQEPTTRRRRVCSSGAFLTAWALADAIREPFAPGGCRGRERRGDWLVVGTWARTKGVLCRRRMEPVVVGGGWSEGGGYATLLFFRLWRGRERVLKVEGVEEEEDCAEDTEEDLWRAARFPELGATKIEEN